MAIVPVNAPNPEPSRTAGGSPASAGEGEFLNYNDFIHRQLGRTQGQVKSVELFSELLILIVASVGYLLTVVLFDHWLVFGGLGTASRLFFCGALFVGAGVFAWVRILPLLLRDINPIYAADTIERSTPSLKNSLINFLLLRGDNAPLPKLLYDAIEERAATDLSSVPVEGVVDRTRMIKIFYVLMALVAFGCVYKLASPKDPIRSMGRVIFPWTDLAAPTRVTIEEVKPGDSEAFLGSSVTVKALVMGLKADETATLYYSTEDGSVVHQAVPLVARESLQHEARLPPEDSGAGLGQSIRYYLTAGDFRTADFRITVVPPPTIVVDSIEYEYPNYTGMGRRVVKGQGDLKALEGTRVVVHALANQTIQSNTALLDLDSDGKPPTLPLRNEGDDGKRVWGAFELKLAKDGSPEHESYLLRYRNADGTLNPTPIRHRIEVIPDLAPMVEFAAPAKDVELPLNQSLELAIRAADQDFALNQVMLRMTVRDRELFPPLQPAGDPGLPLIPSGKPAKLQTSYVFSPAKLGLSAGDEVTYWAIASDAKTSVDSQRWHVKITSPARPNPNELARNDQPQGPNTPDPKNNPQNGNGRNGNNAPPNDAKDPAKNTPNNPSDPSQNPQSQNPAGQNPPGDPKNNDPKNGASNQPAKPDEVVNPEQDPARAFEKINEHRKETDKEEPQPEEKEEPKKEEPKTKQPEKKNDSGGDEKGKKNEGSGSSGKQDEKKGGEQGSGSKKGQQNSGGDKQGDKKKEGSQQSGKQNNESGGGKQDNKQGAGKNNADKQSSDGSQQGSEKNGSKNDAGKQGSGKKEGEKGSQSGSEQGGSQGDKQGDGAKKGEGKQSGDAGGEKGPGQEKKGSKQGEGKSPTDQPADPDNEKGPSKQEGGGAGKNPDKDGNETEEGPRPGDDPKTGATKQGQGETKQGLPKKDSGEPKSPGEDSKEDNGDRENAGGGSDKGKNQDGGPTPASQGKQDAKDKNGKSSQETKAPNDKGDKASNPSVSDKNSDSKGGEPGDRKGGGNKGGGQNSNQAGTGGAGSNTEADTGGQPGKEPGHGEKTNRAGNEAPADHKTGKSGSQEGAGSKTAKKEGEGAGKNPQNASDKGPSGKQGDQGSNDPNNSGGEGGKAGSGKPQGKTDKGEAGPGQGEPTQGGTRDGQREAAGGSDPSLNDPVNLNEAMQGVDLALRHLKDELEKPNPDQKLLDSVGGSREKAQQFYDRWKRMRDEAMRGGAENSDARKRFEESVRGLGLSGGTAHTDTGGTKTDDVRNRSTTVVPPPPGYRDRTSGFRTGISKPTPESK